MIETLQPPTDNLYKFLAIGGLAFALVATIYLFREQSRLREQYIDAHSELLAKDYKEGTGMPSDVELRRAFIRREWATSQLVDLKKLAGGEAGTFVGVSLAISFAAFVFWWGRVQRHDDTILRATAAKMKREEVAAKS